MNKNIKTNPSTKPRFRSALQRSVAAVVLASGAAGAWAAGGHHAVDDAAILDAGQCEIEGWFDRARDATRLVHAGANCRVGPVELGIAGEYARQAGVSQSAYALQAKWAQEVGAGWSVGLSAAPVWATHVRPRYQGTTVVALASWAVSDTVGVHGNLGRDLLNQADDESRGGVSIDWTFREGWQVMAERYRQQGAHFVRAGVRWEPAADWTVDLSRSHVLRVTGESSWTMGLTRAFGR